MKKIKLTAFSNRSFGSRKGCRELIEEGEVSVNGEVVSNWRSEFVPEGLVFSVFDEEWQYREHVYLVLNKPSGYECSRKPSSHPGVLSLLPENFEWRDVQTVGRLDHDTTGLLLLSDDGAFIHAQSSPKRHQPKTYIAATAEPVTDKLVANLLAGVKLIDEPAPIAALVYVWTSIRLKSCSIRANTTRSNACSPPPATTAPHSPAAPSGA